MLFCCGRLSLDFVFRFACVPVCYVMFTILLACVSRVWIWAYIVLACLRFAL